MDRKAPDGRVIPQLRSPQVRPHQANVDCIRSLIEVRGADAHGIVVILAVSGAGKVSLSSEFLPYVDLNTG